ncbi:hypothetical protein C6P42_003939, partial [Pichia californica]
MATNFISTRTGFDATAYSYSFNSDYNTANDVSYYDYSYRLQSVVGIASNVKYPDIFTDLYGAYDQIFYDGLNGYSLQLTGYFVPTQTGIYAFKTDNIDDALMLWIGTSNAFECCNPNVIPKNSIYSSDESNAGYLFFSTLGNNQNGYIYLEAGVYYPIRVVFVNNNLTSVLKLYFQTPYDSQWLDSWLDYVVSISGVKDGVCIGQDQAFTYSTALSIDTALSDTSITYYEENIATNGVNNTILVERVNYPTPSSTILITTSYSGTAYSTVSYSFYIGDFTTTPIAYNYYYAALPSNATHTYAYTGTSSGTSSLIYVSNANGVNTTVTDVAVLVPEGNTVVTWTATTPATSYITTTAINKNGVPQLTTVEYKYDLMNATHSYAYNGVSVVSSTLIYSATNGNSTYLTTDVAVLYPEGSTLVTWNRTSSLTSYLTTTALINNVPVLTTIEYRFVPSPSSS